MDQMKQTMGEQTMAAGVSGEDLLAQVLQDLERAPKGEGLTPLRRGTKEDALETRLKELEDPAKRDELFASCADKLLAKWALLDEKGAALAKLPVMSAEWVRLGVEMLALEDSALLMGKLLGALLADVSPEVRAKYAFCVCGKVKPGGATVCEPVRVG